MMRSLPEQMADLAGRARQAEELLAAARTEPHDRVLEWREEARVTAHVLAHKIDDDIRAAGSVLAGPWHALRKRLAADLDRLRHGHPERRHDLDLQRATDRAARLESEATVAIDYALASIEDAKVAVLDAVLAELDAADAMNS